MPSLLAFLGSLGMPELLIIGVIVLLLFGNRLPSVMRSLGRGVVEFKKGVAGEDEEDGHSSRDRDEKGHDDKDHKGQTS